MVGEGGMYHGTHLCKLYCGTRAGRFETCSAIWASTTLSIWYGTLVCIPSLLGFQSVFTMILLDGRREGRYVEDDDHRMSNPGSRPVTSGGQCDFRCLSRWSQALYLPRLANGTLCPISFESEQSQGESRKFDGGSHP